MRIAITAASGLIGSTVKRALDDAGHTTTRLVRSREAATASDAIFWSMREGTVDTVGLEGHDVVIHLSGENIKGLWTAAKKKRIRDSRVESTRLLSETLAGLDRKPHTLLTASAVGIYGDRPPDEPLDESAAPGDTFFGELGVAWEGAADPAREAGIRVVHLRFGLVMTPKGGILEAVLPIFKLGLGASFGDGSQITPWVALDEVPAVIRFLMDRPAVHGPVNVVAPDVVTNEEWAETLGRVLGRPVFLNVPSLLMEVLGDLGQELTAGARVVPRKLQEAGYEFRFPELRGALEAMI